MYTVCRMRHTRPFRLTDEIQDEMVVLLCVLSKFQFFVYSHQFLVEHIILSCSNWCSVVCSDV